MPRRTVNIYDGDDFERLTEAHNAVARAENVVEELEERAADKTARFGGSPEDLAEAREAVQVAKDAYDALVDEAAERADAWVVESIGFEAWTALVEAHPKRMVPKPGGEDGEQVVHEDDAPVILGGTWIDFGVNTKTFGKALLLFVDPEDDEHRTIARIGDDVPTDLAKRVRRLSKGQFDTLWIMAHQLNVGGVTDPKALRFSTAPRSTES